MTTKLLGPADQAALFAFLDEHLDTSLLFFSNIKKAGIEDHGQPLQGTYVASLAQGAITAVAGHSWNGIVFVQGDAGIEEAVHSAVHLSGRALTGFLGPRPLVERARRALGTETRKAIKDVPEILFALDLEKLQIPSRLGETGIVCRLASPAEDDGLLVDWRIEYGVETMGEARTPAMRERFRSLLSRLRARGWVLCHEGKPVSYSTFTASAHGVVQVGGVYTPAALRRQGYARAVVAASLLDARAEGQRRSVLFTSVTNVAAQRSYTALGFQPVGEFGFVLFG